jgi:hypothetical protein
MSLAPTVDTLVATADAEAWPAAADPERGWA